MRTRDILIRVKRDGAAYGAGAAGWVFDGNTTQATYESVLGGIEIGDPEMYDRFRTPDLSGEYEGDPTPRTLAADYDISEARWEEIGNDVCQAWEDAASTAFWDEIERVCRVHVPATAAK